MKTKAWISAMRLRTLPLSFSVILMGSALAFETNRYSSSIEFSWWIFGLTLLTTLLLQVLSNLANDYGDALKGADNEGRIGPERAIQSGAISHKTMFKAIVLNAILALISGIALLLVAFEGELNWLFITFVLIGIASIGAAIKYTVGKGAYGYSGLGDLFVFIFFGLLGVLGTLFLQTHEFRWEYVLVAATMGLFSVAVLNLNNMRDRENDKAVGKNTLAVKLGFRFSKIYHYTIFVLAYLCGPMYMIYRSIAHQFYGLLIVVSIPLLIHIIHLRKVKLIKDPKDFDPELKKVALSAFLFGLLFFIFVLFN